ncbi:MAG TPA: hypothetical protein VL326_12895 [Kofleriaceae bacterium]|nr:hypothetical protein [Kofleriaceae bacterium]
MALLLAYVAFKPGVSYAPVQRTILFAILATGIGVSLGKAVKESKVEIHGGWLVASYAGAPAVVIGLMFMLAKLSAPDRQIALYHVITPNNEKYTEISKFGDSVLSVETDRGGISTRPLVEMDGNAFALVFPEQVPSMTVNVRYPPATGKWYSATLTYTGEGDNKPLVIGKQLKPAGE